MFTIDSNILINLYRLYPRKVFESLWGNLESAIKAGHVCICEAVFDELDVRQDSITAWVKERTGFVCDESQEDDMNLANAISDKHKDWARDGKNAADPFVIAHAVNTQRQIVTADKRMRHIAATDHKVQTFNLLEWIIRQGWTF